jgi:hypothetical protein
VPRPWLRRIVPNRTLDGQSSERIPTGLTYEQPPNALVRLGERVVRVGVVDVAVRVTHANGKVDHHLALGLVINRFG